MLPIRPLSLVRLKPEWLDILDRYPFAKDLPLVFLGEIPNLPGHGVFLGHHSGHAYSGFHIDAFEELPEDEV